MILAENTEKSILSEILDIKVSLWKAAIVVPILVIAVIAFGILAVLAIYLAIGLIFGLIVSSDEILKTVIKDWEKENNVKYAWDRLIATAIFGWILILMWKNEDNETSASP